MGTDVTDERNIHLVETLFNPFHIDEGCLESCDLRPNTRLMLKGEVTRLLPFNKLIKNLS